MTFDIHTTPPRGFVHDLVRTSRICTRLAATARELSLLDHAQRIEEWAQDAAAIAHHIENDSAYHRGMERPMAPSLMLRDTPLVGLQHRGRPGRRGGVPPLTERQCEVAVLIARGRTNAQIAEALVVTPGTAANHVEHILGRLGCSNRAQVAAWAAEHLLLDSLPD